MNFVNVMFLAILPAYMHRYGISNIDIGIVIASYALGALSFRLFFVDNIEDIKCAYVIMVAGLMVMIGLLVISVFLPSPWAAVGRVVQGFGHAAFFTACGLWVVRHSDQYNRGKRLGQMTASSGFAIVSAPAVGIYLAQHIDIKHLYVISALSALLVLVLRIQSQTHKADCISDQPVCSYEKCLVLLCVIVLSSTLSGLEAFLPIISTAKGIDSLLPLYIIFGVALVIGRLGGGLLSDKFGSQKIIGVGVVAVALSLFVFSVNDKKWLFFFMALTYAVSYAVTMTGLMVNLTLSSSARRQGRVIAHYSVANDIGLCVGAVIVGYCADRYGVGLDEAIAIIAVTAPLTILFLQIRNKQFLFSVSK